MTMTQSSNFTADHRDRRNYLPIGPNDSTLEAAQQQAQGDVVLQTNTVNDFVKHRRQRAALWALTIVTIILFIYSVVLTFIISSTVNDNKTIKSDACNHIAATGNSGAVATTQEHATRVGMDILKRGGNAFDAAVAIQFALNVVQPQSTGIGGGCFVVFYSAKTGEYHAIDGREEAPKNFDEWAFCKDRPQCTDTSANISASRSCVCSSGPLDFSDRITGGLSVGVPGVVSAAHRILSEHGSMSWDEVLAPAIDIADNGFAMYGEMHSRLMLNRQRMLNFPASRDLFFPKHDQQPLDIGEIFYNHELASTLRMLANDGPSAFYNGSIADDIVATVVSSPNPTTGRVGSMTVSDLANYKAVYRKPTENSYRNYTIHSMPLPSSGGPSLVMMLNLLERFDIGAFKQDQGEYLHRLLDAQDAAFSDRALYMGDADFLDPPPPINELTSKMYAFSRSESLFSPFYAARALQPDAVIHPGVPHSATTSYYLEHHAISKEGLKPGTTHFVVSDQLGNVVSWTTTIEENFGSGVTVPGRGFLLNNQLTDFDPLPYDSETNQSYANGPQSGWRQRRSALGTDAQTFGGKRPMSSMSPTIVSRNQLCAKAHGASFADVFTTSSQQNQPPFLALGSPGGSMIIGTVLNALVGMLDFGKCIGDAIMTPRALSFNTGPASLEDSLLMSPQYADALELLSDRGFPLDILATHRPLSYVQALIIRDDRTFEAFADSRLNNSLALAY